MRPNRPRPLVRYTTFTVILAFLLLLGLTATAFADNYFNDGVSWGANLPSIPNARDLNPMGINTFLDQEVDRGKVSYSLKMIAGGGFHWVRQGFAWNDIEISAKGDFTDTRDPAHPKSSWNKYDFIVDEANSRGLEIIARLDSTPNWARNPCDANRLPNACDDLKKYTKGPPTNYNDYGDFVYAVVSHYKGKIRYFQIWNEPNLEGEWGGKPINAADFTRLLKIAYTRAKQANPDAVIIMPGLAPTDDKTYPANESDLLYLQDMYNAGAKDYFDIASVMIYGFQEPPTTHRTEFNRFNFSRPILTHELMVKNGDGNKPIWGSEYAWLALSPSINWPPDPRYGNQKSLWGNGVDEQTQGDWLKQGYERTRSDWPWMGVMNVWKFRDPINDPTQPASWFSIVNNDFSPRPAYNILHDYARTGAWGTVADVGVHTADSAAITWQGNWSKASGVAGGKKDDRLTIASIGDGLKLATNAPLHYQVDGGNASDASPSSDGALDIPFGSSAYSHTITVQLLADNTLVSGFTTYRNQPLLLAAGIPAAYVISSVGLVVSAYRLLPWLVYLLDMLFQYLLFAFAWLWGALRWLGRAIVALLRRLAFTFIYLSLPKNTINPAVTARYLPTWLTRIQNSKLKIQNYLLVASVALFYLPVTRAELLRDINPWSLIIGGLLTAFFTLLTPETALALTIALVPLYLAPGYLNIGFMDIGWGPKYIGHSYFPIAELLLLLTAALVGWRILVGWLVSRFASPSWQPEDRARTTVMPAIRTPLAQVVQYLRADAFAILAVLWVAVGGFSLLTVADRQYLSDSIRELRWTIIEPVLFYFLYVHVVRSNPLPTSPAGRGAGSSPPPVGEAGRGAGSSPPPVGEAGRGQTQRKMFLLFDFFIGAAVVVSIIGIVQFFFGTNTVNVENLSRVVSVYEHPNSLALYLGRALPIVVAFAMLLPVAYRQRRIIYAVASCIIGITLYLTYSRGAILGIGGALAVIALLGGWGVIIRLWQARRSLVVAAGGLALVLGVGGAYLALARLTDTGSISLRGDIWSAALHMIKDHPIFGVGLDQFANQYPHYANAAVRAAGEIFTSHPHNFLLDYWLRLGIIGLLLGGLTLFLFYRFGWWLWRLTRTSLHRAIVVALLASMTDFVLHGLVDQAYFVPDLALIFWFTLASMEATRRSVLDEKL